MDFNTNVRDALMGHITNEMYASQCYLQAAYFFEDENMVGIAGWMKKESDSEREHAIKIADFLAARGASVKLPEIKAAALPMEPKKYLPIFQALFQIEQQTTKQLNELAKLAHEQNDHASYSFLLPMLDDQVKAEDEFDTILTKVAAYSALPGLMFHLDAELKK
mmetsp:Transcript_9483/g.23730  ORF Transcript_9483/g.23730 Transcript_9483/m.23730 type:complete len:164 (+) Transcript_9483:63-554(+)|eukprot:CAMPEP_0177662056 /NCGR_PEP_ID=MMETSP0447-20121125/19059_1 /TAXON_ID=0 /ORGANISM="Stygamoeba regulata, Strain BSH-02190019" /LENGTH=163 /DNA_ID=CAMNT_0019167541 /DNA_START=63 /DNA_END=554 /DNA_ORIENTATION=-